MAWASRAVAHESVSRERMTLDWLKRRQRRRGCLNVIVSSLFEPGPVAEVVRWAKTIGTFGYAGLLGLAAASGVDRDGRAPLTLQYACGRWLGHRGRRVEEYGLLPSGRSLALQ